MRHFRTYKSLCTDFYDIEKPEASPDQLAFFLKYVKEASGRILEPMCGSGRFLIPIMEQGYAIDGIDASKFMLDSLRKKCERKRLIPLLRETLLQKADLEKKYALAIIPSGSFCLLTSSEDVEDSLKVIYNALQPGAKFVFEIEMESLLSEEKKHCQFWCGRWVKKADGSLIVLSTLLHYDEKTQIETTLCKYEHVQKNQIIQTEVEEYCLKLYKHREIETQLAKAGFSDIKITKPYDWIESEPSDPTAVVECAKKG
jgi:SAM-dependent methyltransferase